MTFNEYQEKALNTANYPTDFKIIYPRLKKYINPDIITEDKKTKKLMSNLGE